jgi:putative superfamily III holin-X
MATQIEDEGLSDIGRAIADDARRMVELEVALARAEAVRTAVRARNSILLVSAGITLVFQASIFWLLALAFALGLLQHPIGYFLVGCFFLLLAGVAILLGYFTIRRAISGAEGAVEGIKGDVEWARELPSRRVSSSS